MEQGSGLAPALCALVERLRALRSAWVVLAPSGLSAEKTDIAEIGRALNDDLIEMMGRESTHPDLVANAEIEARLDSLETEMREIAFKITLAQLRSTLPECLSHNRRGLLDLLDLMLSAELSGLDGTRARIPAIDYVITLLCSVGSDQPPHDPVQLTPRLHELCERSSIDYDPRLPEIEAEFFHAASLDEADARLEPQLRALQTRKAELGGSYFAPQVLRAITTYNSALLQSIDEKVLASQDWGTLPPVAEEPHREISVFDTPALPQIAQALRRRAAGKAPELSATDRIAWCLDLEYPTADEREALRNESSDPPDDLTVTVILVGLLCRSSVILEDEFPTIGITATQLFDEWVPELCEALQEKVSLGISGADYREACLLSELKTRYLYASMAELRRKNRPRAPTPGLDTTGTAGSARATGTANTTGTPRTAGTAKPIIQEALVNARASARKDQRPARKHRRAQRLKAMGIAIAGALLVFGVGRDLLWNSDLERFDRGQLDQASPYLSNGARSGKGQGPAFVGEIRSSWSALEAADRMLVATDLVEALRETGVRDVMIYDDDGLLRIQALGEQPPRILPGSEPEH
jgi:hypothetical protein